MYCFCYVTMAEMGSLGVTDVSVMLLWQKRAALVTDVSLMLLLMLFVMLL